MKVLAKHWCREGWQRWLRMGLSLVMAIALLLPLTGCSLEQFKTEAAQVPRIVIASPTDPKTFNYALNQSFPSVFYFLYDGLLFDNSVTSELEPALAEDWNISDDDLAITFTLKEELQWSDGEPLTIDDVLFSFNEVYLNEAIPAPVRDILRIGQAGAFPTVEPVGDRQVRFTTPEPFAPFLRIVGGLPILPAHALRESVQTTNSEGEPLFLSTWGTDTDAREIIGSGAYRMVNYTPAERLTFERNPYYWRTDEQGNSQPYIDQLIWQIVESADTTLLQFRTGAVDMMGVSPQNFMLLKREEERGNFTIHEGGPTLSTFFICFNLNIGQRNGIPLVDPIKSSWFNTVEFRQAISYAIDRRTMINNLLLGLGEPLLSSIPKQSPFFLSPEEGLPVYDYDPERSRELLQSAGFQYDSDDQLRDDDGNPVSFTIMTNTGRTTEVAGSQIKRDLEKIGIEVVFQPLDFNTLLDRLRNTMDWDAYIGGITGGLEPHGYSTIWALDGSLHTFNRQPQPGQDPIEGQEFADWEQRIADLFVAGSQELDQERRKDIYGEAQMLIQENLPFIYLVTPLQLGAIRNTIENVEYSAIPDWSGLWNIFELEFATESPVAQSADVQ